MKPSELTQQVFTDLYQKLKTQISDETPLHWKESGVPSAPQEPNVAGQEADIAEATRYLDDWYGHATDGELAQIATVGGQTPWRTLQDARNAMEDAKTDLDSAKTSLSDDWTGPAAADYVAYLDDANSRLNDFVSGDDHCVDRARGLMREAYAAAAGFKHDLYELGKAASAAIDSFQEHDAEILLTGGIGIATIAAGAALTVASGGFAAAVLGAIASTAGGEVFGAAQDLAKVSGDEPVDIMRALNEHVKTSLSSYHAACGKVVDAMSDLVTDLRSYTHEQQLTLPPEVQPSGTSFSLRDFFPKDATNDTGLVDKVG